MKVPIEAQPEAWVCAVVDYGMWTVSGFVMRVRRERRERESRKRKRNEK